ncbi:MAG: hypothetical protein AAF512_07305 [Pseudomonadota bacterium]
MRTTIIQNLTARFSAYSTLANQVADQAIAERLETPKHKSLGEHLWCVVGARESYSKALTAGEWVGFNCSMDKFERGDFAHSLEISAQAVLESIENIEDWTPARDELLANLYEHEVMHEGQIIRHMYGMDRAMPGSWKWA